MTDQTTTETTEPIFVELVEIDLFDRSNFAWADVSPQQDGGEMVATGFDSFAVVTRRGDHWAVIGGGLQPKDGARTARIIAVGDRKPPCV